MFKRKKKVYVWVKEHRWWYLVPDITSEHGGFFTDYDAITSAERVVGEKMDVMYGVPKEMAA